MQIDLQAKAIQLLERIANSLYERETNPTQIFFSSKEIEIVKEWMEQVLNEDK